MNTNTWIVFAVFGGLALAQPGPLPCIPVFTATPNINGLVATDPFHLISGTSDAAWAVTPYQRLKVLSGVAVQAAFFPAISVAAGKPDHVYLGLHVQEALQVSPSAQLYNANGSAVREPGAVRYLLSDKARRPADVAGALIGSFKPDFPDSFFIGTEATLLADPGASKLYLAINDADGAYRDNLGPGFNVSVVATPPTILPNVLTWAPNPALGIPGTAPLAANIPVFNIEVMQRDRARQTTVPIGQVGYAVFGTHGRNGGLPKRP